MTTNIEKMKTKTIAILGYYIWIVYNGKLETVNRKTDGHRNKKIFCNTHREMWWTHPFEDTVSFMFVADSFCNF